MLRSVAVADAFMSEVYYRDCFAKFEGEFSLDKVLWFGTPDRYSMREINHKIERQGAYAVEPPAEIYGALADAQVLMVHLCPVTEKVIASAPKLKLILSNRGGLENIDLEAASRHGIPVLHNPAHNANAVTELAIGLMLSETRNLARTHMKLMNGEWCETFANSGKIYELAGQTIGLIGFGNIGRRVARKLTVFDTHVLVTDPAVKPDDPDLKAYNCTLTDLDTVLSSSYIVSLHARSNDLILTREKLALMKPDSYFINTARPHMVDNKALYEMLHDKKLLGAAFDVFMDEPLHKDDPLLTLDNVTLSNHRGGDTVNCYSDSPKMLLAEAKKYLCGEKPKFFANEKTIVKK